MLNLPRIVMAVALMLVALPAFAAESYTASQAVRDKGFAALVARMGESRPVAKVTFGPDEIAVVAQPGAGRDYAKWVVSRIDLGVVNFHFVNGPTREPDTEIVDDPAGAYFRLSEIDLGKFDSVVEASIEKARLQHVPVIRSVEIARTVSILPEPAYGDVHWTVTLGTDDESAIVYFNRDGEVIGADLSDTQRADDLDLFATDDWPMAEAQSALASVLGSSPVHSVEVYRDHVLVTADHPTDPDQEREYSWRLGGVTRGLIDTPNLITLGMGHIATYSFDEVDLTKLPKVKAAARKAFGAPDAVITGIVAEKSTDRAASGLRVLWDVEFKQTDGEEGEVIVDIAGNVVEVKLPDSRVPEAGPWLAPATIVDTIRRISEAFGPDAKLSEISINDTQASLDIEDPQAPGEVAHFLMDAHGVSRFGTGSFFASLDAGNVFTPADLAGLTTEQLADMVRRTEQRLRMDGGTVFRYTFSRHALIMDESDNRLMVEIRYGVEQGNAGWMTFLLDGTQTDELIP